MVTLRYNRHIISPWRIWYGSSDGCRFKTSSACRSVVTEGQNSVGGCTYRRRSTTNGVSVAGCFAGTGYRWLARHEQGRETLPDVTRTVRFFTRNVAGRPHRQWIRHRSLDHQTGAPADREGVPHQIQRCPCLAVAGHVGILQPETREAGHVT